MSSDAPAPDQTPDTPDPTGKFFTTVRSWGLVRGDDRWFAGVCGAVAGRLGIDAVVVRGALAALTLVGGLGLLVYGVAWALLPDARGRIEAQAAVRGDVSTSLGGAVVLVVADLLVSRGVLGIGGGWWSDGRGWSFLVTGLVGALAWWVLRDYPFERRATPRPVAPEPVAGTPGPATAGPVVDLTKRPRTPHDDATRPIPVAAPAPPPAREPAAGHGSPAERRAAARLAAQEKARVAAARARAERRPGSPLLTAAVTGLALLAAGAVVVAGQFGELPAGTLPLALAAAVTVLGLGAVLAGLRGRRTALVGSGVWLALLAVASTALPQAGNWQWEVDSTWRPDASSLAQEEALSAGVGRLRVDPADLGSPGATPAVAVATMAAGRLEVSAPEDRTVLVDARALAGTVRWEDSGSVVPVDATVAADLDPDIASSYVVGGLDVSRVLAVGPDAAAVAEGTTVRGDDPRGWSVPAGVAVVDATTWAGEVRVGAAQSVLLEGE